MAKIKKLLALGLCLCMAAGITVGCGDSKSSKNGTDSGKNTNDGLSFAFCTNTLNNTFQSSIDSKLKELCDKDGISYTCLDPDYDLNKQLSQLSDVANNGYDAVFVIPVDSAGITSGLAEISEAGIPIFNVDTAVIDDDLESFVTQFVGTNAYMAGQLVGEQMVKDHPDGGNIAILDFPSNESCVDRVNGFLDGLGDSKDKFKIVAQQDGGAALDKSMELAEDIITASPIWMHFSVSMIHLHLVLQLLLKQQIKQAKLVYIVLMPHRMENRHYWMMNLQLLHVGTCTDCILFF